MAPANDVPPRKRHPLREQKNSTKTVPALRNGTSIAIQSLETKNVELFIHETYIARRDDLYVAYRKAMLKGDSAAQVEHLQSIQLLFTSNSVQEPAAIHD